MSVPYGKVKDTDILVPLEVDANGIISVAVKSGDLNAQNHGHISGAWQKSPIAFGASGSKGITVSDTQTVNGNYTIRSTAVPAGEYWVFTSVNMLHTGTVPGSLVFALFLGGADTALWNVFAPTAYLYYHLEGFWVLFPGDKITVTINGLIGNTTYLANGLGYRVDTDL